MQDNNPVVPSQGQAPINPPVAPTTPVAPAPMTPVTPAFQETVVSQTPPVVSPEPKKSPIIKIAVIILILAVFAGVAYYVGQIYLGKQSAVNNSQMVEEDATPKLDSEYYANPDSTEAGTPSAMPASDSPDLIPTLPENSP